MTAEAPIVVVPENPNAHGGCICSRTEVLHGCEGPFAVVAGDQEFAYPYSPNVVISAGCLDRLNLALDTYNQAQIASRESHEIPNADPEPRLPRPRSTEKGHPVTEVPEV